MPPARRRRRARRRAIRLARFLQSWPLWYLGAIPVGLAVTLTGFATGRDGLFRLGAWIAAPGVGLLIWLASMLVLATVVNLGVFAWDVGVCAREAIRGQISRARPGGRR